MRCLQNLVIKAKQRELDIQTKAGLMAAQGKIYGLVDTDDDNQLDLLKNQISAEIERLVEKARADALKLNPHPNKDAARIYSPASNNALAVDKYLDLQKRPANYRRAYCTRTTPFSEQAVCNILKSALADELED